MLVLVAFLHIFDLILLQFLHSIISKQVVCIYSVSYFHCIKYGKYFTKTIPARILRAGIVFGGICL